MVRVFRKEGKSKKKIAVTRGKKFAIKKRKKKAIMKKGRKEDTFKN